MTILRDGDDRQIECEDCPDTLDVFDKDDFNDMIADAKSQGWTVRKDANGDWEHVCMDCMKARRLDNQRRLLGGKL